MLPTDTDPLTNILIVDDEPANLLVLETVLDDPGYRVVRAQSADQALRALMADEFAVMVLDIQLPDMNGIELAQMIKERKKTAHLPIIFLTAYFDEDQHRLQGYGTGAVDYLSKPVNAEILRSKVAVFIELYLKTHALARVNAALENEVAERQKAQEALQQISQELELRVRERTAELTVAHRGVRENEERLRVALDVAQMTAWEWDIKSGRMTWSQNPETLFGFPRGTLGPEQRLLLVAPVADFSTLAGKIAFGTVKSQDAAKREITVELTP